MGLTNQNKKAQSDFPTGRIAPKHKQERGLYSSAVKGGKMMASVWGGVVELFAGFTIRARAIV